MHSVDVHQVRLHLLTYYKTNSFAIDTAMKKHDAIIRQQPTIEAAATKVADLEGFRKKVK